MMIIFNCSIRSQILECRKIVFRINWLGSLDMSYQNYSHLKIVNIMSNRRKFYDLFNPIAKSLCFKDSYLPNDIPNSEMLNELEIECSEWLNTGKIGNSWNMPELKSLRISRIRTKNMKKVQIYLSLNSQSFIIFTIFLSAFEKIGICEHFGKA